MGGGGESNMFDPSYGVDGSNMFDPANGGGWSNIRLNILYGYDRMTMV